jgi:hypothetical protein
MVNQSHDVRFTASTLPDDYDGLPCRRRGYSGKGTTNVPCWISDIEEIGSFFLLGPASILTVGQLDGRRPHVASLEFLSQF